MLEQRPCQQLAGRLVGADEQREEPFFLVTKVRAGLAGDEAEEGGCGLAPLTRVAITRPAKSSRLHETVMMVVRERNQGRMSLHAPSLALARAPLQAGRACPDPGGAHLRLIRASVAGALDSGEGNLDSTRVPANHSVKRAASSSSTRCPSAPIRSSIWRRISPESP